MNQTVALQSAAIAVQHIPVDQIVPNADQPRKQFDPIALDELAASIKADGLMQPITVRPIAPDTYEIVGGERRWRAHKLLASRGDAAGTCVPCIVRYMDVQARDVTAIIENLLRVDVTPLEEAHAFDRLVKAGMTPEDIARRTGAQAQRIRQRLLLINLEPSIAKLLATGNLNKEAATEIARLPDKADQLRIVQMINRGQIGAWSSVKAAVDTALGVNATADIFGASAPPVSAQETATLNRLERKVDEIVAMVSSGFKDGECVIANRVNPDRARLMADKLQLIRGAVRTMERQLREVNAQAAIVIEEKLV
jgi:ParB family chromosome partitioning protein